MHDSCHIYWANVDNSERQTQHITTTADGDTIKQDLCWWLWVRQFVLTTFDSPKKTNNIIVNMVLSNMRNKTPVTQLKCYITELT